MIRILIVSSDENSLLDFESALRRYGEMDISRTESGGRALSIASEKAFDLVVTDEYLNDMSGLDFAEKLVSVNPLINCVSVSRLSPKAFHEKSEGLGLLMQLPPNPGSEHAKKLMEQLKNVLNLTTKVSSKDVVEGFKNGSASVVSQKDKIHPSGTKDSVKASTNLQQSNVFGRGMGGGGGRGRGCGKVGGMGRGGGQRKYQKT
ncbi:MAG: response regulator [Deltaproteobacteria bacterium]|nr:response regulator [Deltaproteobacteria bacterium]